ncbi:MAG: exonuclease SbcCD subunit D C-terminal domain-containing protein [Planctomycetota bacterium]
MLTLFHTADWHLGQSFFGFGRDYEHAAFLDWLLVQLQEHQPEALLLSGDVFDTIHPSAAAQKMYYSFLARARHVQPELQLIITAGNHDAGGRLEAPAGLLESFRIHVVGTPLRPGASGLDLERLLIPIRGRSGAVEAFVVAMPFLRPADVPGVPDASDPWLDGIRVAYRQAVDFAVRQRDAIAPGAALIAMGHCHVAGGLETTDSERRLVVGHSEAVSPDIFPADLCYTALGHLHRAQAFQDGRVRYSGSPIPLSFTESGYRHQVLRLEFSGSQLTGIESLHVPRSVPLLTVPEQESEELEVLLPRLSALKSLPEVPLEQQPFLRVQVLETGPDPGRRTKIEQALEGCPVRLVQLQTQQAARLDADSAAAANEVLEDLSSLQEEDVLMREFRKLYGREPDLSLLQAFHEVLQSEGVAE